MRRSFPIALIIILTGYTLFILSCTAASCFDPTESKVKAYFYNDSTKLAQPPDSLTLFGMDMDTNKIYDSIVRPKSAEFPLFAADTSVKFVISINGTDDTIEFHYSSYLHLLSKECGYTYFFNLDTVIYTDNIIRSIIIDKKTITTLNEENMRIFY